MINELKIGPQIVSDGSQSTARGEKSGATVVQDAHGHFYESVYRGNVFIASVGVAGTAPGTALSTTAALCLWNPPASGKNLVFLTAEMGYVSGTLGAGTVEYAYGAATSTPTGTALTVRNAMIGSVAASVVSAFAAATVTAPTLIKPSPFTLGATLATTAVGYAPFKDLIDGGMVLTPGNIWVMQAVAAAGSTPLVQFAATWEEVPV